MFFLVDSSPPSFFSWASQSNAFFSILYLNLNRQYTEHQANRDKSKVERNSINPWTINLSTLSLLTAAFFFPLPNFFLFFTYDCDLLFPLVWFDWVGVVFEIEAGPPPKGSDLTETATSHPSSSLVLLSLMISPFSDKDAPRETQTESLHSPFLKNGIEKKGFL